MCADALPLFAAINAFVKIRNTFLDVTIKHVIFVDLSSASLDDLIGDLCEETLHSLGSIIVFTQLPDNSDVVQSFRKNLWDVFWATLLNFSARLRKHAEVLQVVLSLIISSLDLLFKFDESWEI